MNKNIGNEDSDNLFDESEDADRGGGQDFDESIKKESRKYRQLDPATEKGLRHQALLGDQWALNKLIGWYDPVIKMEAFKNAAKFGMTPIDADDLMQEGRLVFKKALEEFNPNKKDNFKAFLIRVLDRAMQRYYQERGSQIKSSRYIQAEIIILSKSITRLTMNLERPPTTEEIARDTGFSGKKIEELQRFALLFKVTSLNALFGDESEEASEQSIAAPHSYEPEFIYEEREEDEGLSSAVQRLPDKHRYVIRGRLAGQTFEEIADEIGLSKSRAQQLHDEALQKLIQYLAWLKEQG